MIRPVTVLKVGYSNGSGEPIEIERISRFEIVDPPELDREKWLWLATAKRDCHPLLYSRKMICKRIDRIEATNDNTYRVFVRRDSEMNELVVLNCESITNIETNPESDDTIIFTFKEYFSDEERAELHEIFLNGEYDNLVGVPEF
jgi:hypothetical protein